MPTANLSVKALIETARELLAQRKFDPDVAIELLDRLKQHDLDTQTIGAIAHARMVVVSALVIPAPSQMATARLALARVVTLLER